MSINGRIGFFTVALAAASLLAAGNAQANEVKVERQGPLAALPSEPQGEHLAKIAALGDNEWVNLGSPAPDPKWGKARGRSWSPEAPFAPDLRGAFYFGEGTHGYVKPDGHYMDDLWFYDIHQHRWICVYPGIKADGGYEEIIINEAGFEATPDGQPLPIATMVHAYGGVTYDTDRKLFLSMPCPGEYWGDTRPQRGVRGRKKGLAETGAVRKERRGGARGESPWIYNSGLGQWERYRTAAPTPRSGFGHTLVYVPSVGKSFFMHVPEHAQSGDVSRRAAWYDHDERSWTSFRPGGPRPPFGIEPTSCFDSKRNRIYFGGGIYPAAAEGRNALWIFDVETSAFINPNPEGYPGSPKNTAYGSHNALMHYDTANDVVLLIKPRGREPGIYAYHPGENKWEVVEATRPPMLAPNNPSYAERTGFYDPALNVHFIHSAGDSMDNGIMLAYRYKKAVAKP